MLIFPCYRQYTNRAKLSNYLRYPLLDASSAGHPIVDGIGEGKPENQNNSQPYQHARFLQVRGSTLWFPLSLDSACYHYHLRVTGPLPRPLPLTLYQCPQTLDMNQTFFIEEGYKVANALRFVGRVKRASGRVVGFVGLREHIFSEYDGSPALFMSQGEWVFALMWQRLMASPFRVRFHYGHPGEWP